MTERSARVIVDEAVSEFSGESYLRVDLVVDGEIEAVIAFDRNASPEEISRTLHEMGCFIKYEDVVELSEEERQRLGDSHIEASYTAPGLGG